MLQTLREILGQGHLGGRPAVVLLSFLDPLFAVVALSTGHPSNCNDSATSTDLHTDLVCARPTAGASKSQVSGLPTILKLMAINAFVRSRLASLAKKRERAYYSHRASTTCAVSSLRIIVRRTFETFPN